MDKQAKIYVAGHTGLVGSAIVRKLQERGYGNLLLKHHAELDLQRQDAVEKFFAAEKPEYVFFAAAKVGGILANNTYKADFIYENLVLALNIIHAAHKHRTVKLLNMGSSCIYPKLAPQPLKEEYLLSGYLEPTNEPYAVAKIAAIKLCRYFNEQYGTNFISAMPTNLYGPQDNFNLETAHVLPSLMRKFYLAKLLREKKYDALISNVQRYPLGFGVDTKLDKRDAEKVRTHLEKLGVTGDYVVLWGTGSSYREFLHVDDLADAAVFLMERFNYSEIGELINIGSGEDHTITELALMIKDIVGFQGTIQYDATKPDGTPRKLLDVSRLKSLQWKPSITLEDGLQRTIQWLMSNGK